MLLRDAQIDRLKAIHEQGQTRAEADRRFEQRKQQLIDDFTFIAKCNEGGEFLDQSSIERIQQIAGQTWLRHFDNRLGLSVEEFNRMATQEAQPLPRGGTPACRPPGAPD